jgi:hypothetical protein
MTSTALGSYSKNVWRVFRAAGIEVRDFEYEPMPDSSKDVKMFDPVACLARPQKDYGLRILKGSSVLADHDGLAHCRGRQIALAPARIRRSRAVQRSQGLAALPVRRRAPGTAHLDPVAARTVAPPGRSLQPSGRCSG